MARILKTAYTFDDVLLVPNKSEVLPNQVSDVYKRQAYCNGWSWRSNRKYRSGNGRNGWLLW